MLHNVGKLGKKRWRALKKEKKLLINGGRENRQTPKNAFTELKLSCSYWIYSFTFLQCVYLIENRGTNIQTIWEKEEMKKN